jgi:hypothetical protein
LHIFALSVTTSLKIPGAVIPRRVFTRLGAIVAGPMPYPMRAGMQVAYLHTPRGRAVYSTQGGCGHAGRVALVGMGAFQVRPREH